VTMADLTPDRLQELRRIAEAATPGPWAWREGRGGKILDLIGYGEEIVTPSHFNASLKVKGGVKEYIQAFDPTTVLALLDRIDALEAVLRLVYDEFVLDVARWCRHCRLRIDDHAPGCPMAEVERVLGLAGGATHA